MFYQLDPEVTNPGIYSDVGSSARVVRSVDLPIFTVDVEPLNFAEGEIVTTGNKIGEVTIWNENNQYLKVISDDFFTVGETLNGQSSKTVGIIQEVNSSTAKFDIDATSEIRSDCREILVS